MPNLNSLSELLTVDDHFEIVRNAWRVDRAARHADAAEVRDNYFMLRINRERHTRETRRVPEPLIHSFRGHRSGLLGVLDGTSAPSQGTCGFGTTGSVAERKSPQPSLYSPLRDPERFLASGQSERTELKLPRDETIKVAPSMTEIRKDAHVRQEYPRWEQAEEIAETERKTGLIGLSGAVPDAHGRGDLQQARIPIFWEWTAKLNNVADRFTPQSEFPFKKSVTGKTGLPAGSCLYCGNEMFLKIPGQGWLHTYCRDCGRERHSRYAPLPFQAERRQYADVWWRANANPQDDRLLTFLGSSVGDSGLTMADLLFPSPDGKLGWQEIEWNGGARLSRRKSWPDWLGYATYGDGARAYTKGEGPNAWETSRRGRFLGFNEATLYYIRKRWPILGHDYDALGADDKKRFLDTTKAVTAALIAVRRYYWCGETDVEIAEFLTRWTSKAVTDADVRAIRRSFVAQGDSLFGKPKAQKQAQRLGWTIDIGSAKSQLKPRVRPLDRVDHALRWLAQFQEGGWSRVPGRSAGSAIIFVPYPLNFISTDDLRR